MSNMKELFKNQERIQIHPKGMHDIKSCVTELNAVSNNDGVYAYFCSEETASAYAQVVAVTLRRVEMLMDQIEISEEDGTSYNELELIFSELKKLDQKER